jgi:hypothetical protein
MWSHILLWMQTLTSTEPCEAGALELSDVSVMGLLADMAHGAWMGAEHTVQSQLHGSFQVRTTAKPVSSALCRQHAYAYTCLFLSGGVPIHAPACLCCMQRTHRLSMSHTLYTAAACLTDWQQGLYAKTCLGKLSSKTQTCILGEGCDQMFDHPAAASNINETNSASIDCALVFSCRL